MNVLVGCEKSQVVCSAFRAKGHEAFSCDIQDPTGGHPEWHIQDDVREVLSGGMFITMDMQIHNVNKWDLVIGHPPCTYLTTTGNRWFDVSLYGDEARKRHRERIKAAVFFMHFVFANSDRICIENPIGVMSTAYKKPDQIIQPYEFGHTSRKATCLWLKNLPQLKPTNLVEPEIKTYVCKSGKIATMSADYGVGFGTDHSNRRSRTYEGIANAMADQWG